MRRLIIFFLLLLMTQMLFSDGVPPAGDGTMVNPYLVQTLDNLLWISTNSDSWDNYYEQLNDIDASETANWNDAAGFSPIGGSAGFTGGYDGGGFTIDGLTSYRPDSGNIGLFRCVEGGVIENVNLSHVSITGTRPGSIAGVNSNSLISNCHVSGIIVGSNIVGGIAGKNDHGGVITGCTFAGVIMGEECIGGIAGQVVRNSSVNNCELSGTINGNNKVGGIVGEIENSNVYDCSVDADITGVTRVGGIAGDAYFTTFSNCPFSGSIEGIDAEGLYGVFQGYSYTINSYYDYENVLINNEHVITKGAISETMYQDWLSNGQELEITDYFESEDDYFLISSLEDFKNLLGFVYRSYNSFKLTVDIDLANDPGFRFPFLSATFDGNGHTISNLYINEPERSRVGLFNYIYYNGCLQSLGLIDVNILGNGYIGSIAGLGSNIFGCYSTGSIESNGNYAGGIAGSCGGEISNCFSTTSVNGNGNSRIGGIAGYSSANMDNCYTCGEVSGGTYVGGLTGAVTGKIDNCYSLSNVTGVNYSGGLTGFLCCGELYNSYFSGTVCSDENAGALIGWAAGQDDIEFMQLFYALDLIWNTDMAGTLPGIAEISMPGSYTVFGKTTIEMHQQTTYTDLGWDFVGESINGNEDIWNINAEVNDQYPFINDLQNYVDIQTNEIEPAVYPITIYPNPFNPVTSISFSADDGDMVILTVYNAKGQRVKALYKGIYTPNRNDTQTVIWDGKDQNGREVSSGLYLVRIDIAGKNSYSAKCLMLK